MIFIQRAKSLGLTLEEIQDLVAVAEGEQCALTKAELRQILVAKIADCTERIQGLIDFHATLGHALAQVTETEEPDTTSCPSCTAFAPSCTCVPHLADSA